MQDNIIFPGEQSPFSPGANDYCQNPVMNAILSRHSTRAFSDRQIGRAELEALLQAAAAAPYADEDSRYYTVVQDTAMIDRINRDAKAIAVQMEVTGLAELGRNDSFHCLYHAPVVLFVSGNERSVAPEYDCSAAAQNVLLAAQSLGIASCWIYYALAAFYPPSGEALLRELGIPQHFKPYVSIALGYSAGNDAANMTNRTANASWV